MMASAPERRTYRSSVAATFDEIVETLNATVVTVRVEQIFDIGDGFVQARGNLFGRRLITVFCNIT